MGKTQILVLALLCSAAVASDSAQEIQKRHSQQSNLANYFNHTGLECKVCPQQSECRSNGTNTFPCQCDAECYQFNDCCASAFSNSAVLSDECQDVLSNSLSAFYKCSSLVTNTTQKEIAVYMVSECPPGWTEEEGEEEQELRDIIADNCARITSSFPPVTDADRGVVFRNEYCALCHNARGAILWSTLFSCLGALATILPNQTLTPQLLTMYCYSNHHWPPPFHFESISPRFCTPAISTCLSEHDLSQFIDEIGSIYTELVDGCQNGSQSLVAAFSSRNGNQVIFRNKKCALCNGYYPEDLHCFNNITGSFVAESELQVVLILNTVDNIVHVSSTNIRFSTEFVPDCPEDTIYDAITLRCRRTVCNFVIDNESTQNNNCSNYSNVLEEEGARIIPYTNIRPPNTDTESPTNSTVGDGGQLTCQSVMIIEDMSEFVPINQTLIFHKALRVLTLVIGTAANQLPIVCLDFAIPFINPETLKLFLQLQKFYGGLTFATSTISALFCVSIIVIYFLRPMRSVFGVVVINIAIVFLVSDAVIILVGHSTFASANQKLCVLAAIAEQLINLALFVWLAIFAVDIAIRYHRNANSLEPRSKKKVVAIYILVGWIVPLSLTTVGILGNFATRGAVVQYGLEGACHISHPQSALALFGLPDLISLIIAIVALLVVLVLLCKIQYSFDRRDKCRFILLFTFYLFLILLWLNWFMSLRRGFGFPSFIIQLLLPILFLFRSVFFFFMVAFSKKVLQTIRGAPNSKISPAPDENGLHHLKHTEGQNEQKEGQRDNLKSLINTPAQQHVDESFASYLENPVVPTRTQAWQEPAQATAE